MIEVSTKNMCYYPKENSFVADISDFGKDFRFDTSKSRGGVTLVSHKTNTPVDFYITKVDRDDDNDIIRWILKPDAEQYHTIAFVIYND